jgi:hypothetical protein
MLTCAVPPLIFKLVTEPLNAPTAVPQAVARFATFTVPSPVARSYPVPAVNAGVFVAPLTVTSTPFVPAVVLLQPDVAPVHGTEMFPFVTS